MRGDLALPNRPRDRRCRSQPSLFHVKVTSYLGKLNHARHSRTFENKTPSQAVTDTLARYNMRVDCEPFGPEMAYWRSNDKTDWKTVRDITKRYGRDIYCHGKNVYIKELMTMLKDEHIYEWGKPPPGINVRPLKNRTLPTD